MFVLQLCRNGLVCRADSLMPIIRLNFNYGYMDTRLLEVIAAEWYLINCLRFRGLFVIRERGSVCLNHIPVRLSYLTCGKVIVLVDLNSITR